MCLHPEVNSYICNVMLSLKQLLFKGKVRKVSVVILEEESARAVEQFVFELSDLNNEWIK